ncbi:MAG: flagellar hook-associated protein FlgK [Rhodospirillaceae bacterium]|nr:flagellar hook-associated protein FlgK [Rhodospirillales bacterium]
MSLTLGLNTALSGLLTSQRGLDVISQNVTNVNTKGYTRKVMNSESKVLAGRGAGVQEGAVTRMVSEGLLKDIRRQNSNTGKLEVEQNYYPRMDDLFGEVGDDTSIAHKINDLFSAFQTLGSEANKPATQWSTMQSGQDVADLMTSMTKSLQDMRIEADREIEQTVGQVNTILTNIHDLNQKIVRNGAISSGTSDLEDKRDTALTDLSKLVDVQYFQRADGSMTIYSNSGQMLLDNQPQLLSYSASSTTDTWMTAAGGQFSEITVDGGSQDFGSEIVGGKLRALLDMRDKTLTDLQGNLDELAGKMKETLNLAHNRGTSLPNVSSRYEGTRVFANQGNIVPNAADTAARFYLGSTTVLPATYTSLAITPNVANPWQTDFNVTAGAPFTAANFPAGTVFSIDNAEDTANNGSYRVVSRNSNTSITVEKVNPRQTMQLQGSGDVMIATFDTSGNQLKQTTLNDIMQLDFTVAPNAPAVPYTAATIGTNRSLSDLETKGDHDQWAVNEVSAHVEAWLRASGYTNASVDLNSEGKMVVDVGDDTVSLAFRDQVGSTDGDDAGDATINFDINGDGANDETVEGFSNFFGLNDFYVNDNEHAILDSKVQPSTYTLTANRDLSLYDASGKLGNTVSVARGASLQTIAAAINAQTRTNESVAIASTSTSWTLTSNATITVNDDSGTLTTVTLTAPGPHTLQELAGSLTTGTLTGSVVQEGSSSRLRLTDSRGKELSVSISGGAISGSSMSLGQTLDMTATQRIEASVVPEGSGYRLRIRQTQGGEAYASSTLDANNKNLLTDIGLTRGATGTASNMTVRTDIQTGPEKISRGVVQWNADIGRYYMSEGDNTSALEMSRVMNAKTSVATAGSISAGKYSFSEYASATISVVAQASSSSKGAMEYQSTLNASLDFQNSAYSGVNLDEEISSMMDFQQAYSASAKVISVLQEMLDTLNSMIR